jgi:hypothetical protein
MDAPTVPSDSQPSKQPGTSILTGPRRALLDALNQSDPKTADFYRGALFAFVNQQNPERLIQAAHSIRELLEKAPVLAGGLTAPNQRMNDKLASLRAKFQKLAPHLQEDGTWAPNSEKKVAVVLAELRSVVQWMDANFKQRREEARVLLRALTGPGILLPSDIEDAEIEEFMELKQYFTELSHHRFSVTDEDFLQKLTKAETILLRKLRPEPAADFAAIDALLKEAGK